MLCFVGLIHTKTLHPYKSVKDTLAQKYSAQSVKPQPVILGFVQIKQRYWYRWKKCLTLPSTWYLFLQLNKKNSSYVLDFFQQTGASVKGIKLQMEQEQDKNTGQRGWIVIYISEPVKGGKPKWNCHYCFPLGFIALLSELALYESKP